MDELKKKGKNKNSNKTFEDIKHIDENGDEYWYARELMPLLEYLRWENFENVIKKAIKSYKKSEVSVFEHFRDVTKTIPMPNNANKIVLDYKLTRYACYLIALNGDISKKSIAQAQAYFIIKARKQELSEQEFNMLDETEKRFYNRNITKKGNYQLNQVANSIGVKNFDRFHNEGYKGLYNGETADDIFKRKGLRYREDILDNMDSDELAANIFRISQTKQKLENDNIQGEKEANKVHNLVGKKVRKTIKELGGAMPEDLPTPKKSLKQLEKENKRQLKKK